MRVSLNSFRAAARRALASPRLRAGYVLVIVLTLTALAAGNPGWVGPVLAQTVPTVTKSPTVGPSPTPVPPTAAATELPAPSATPAGPTATPRPTLPPQATSPGALPPSPAAPAGCGAPPRGAASVGPGPRGPRVLRAARFSLWVTQRPVVADPAGLCWVTVVSAPPGRLPPVPAGWVALARGVRLAALGPADQPLVTATRGLLACFQLTPRQPPGALVRLAALGLPAAPETWTLLPTRRRGDQACAPLAALPVTLMLVVSAGP